MEQQAEGSEDEEDVAGGEGLVVSNSGGFDPDSETMQAGEWRFLSVFKGTGEAPPHIVGVPLMG